MRPLASETRTWLLDEGVWRMSNVPLLARAAVKRVRFSRDSRATAPRRLEALSERPRGEWLMRVMVFLVRRLQQRQTRHDDPSEGYYAARGRILRGGETKWGSKKGHRGAKRG